MAKFLVFFLLIATAVAVLSAPTTDDNPAQSKPHMQNSHFSKCAKIFDRDPSGSVPDDVYSCSHECLIYKKYAGGYRENGSCRCC